MPRRTFIRAASDVGGTFTDLVFYDYDPTSSTCGRVRTAKVDTTPPDFQHGVLNGLDRAGVAAAELEFFAHGSTVVINAITERKGVRTGLITTRGFRDILEIGRGNRPDLFNFAFKKPRPFVARHLRAELPERTNYKGEIVRPVELDALGGILDHFRREGVEAIAICFLHAYLNPENEQRAAAAVAAAWPEISVLASHRVSREWREYERTSTTVLSAYVHPIAQRYTESLEAELLKRGFTRELYMMQSNGGIAPVALAKANPISMVESGPASGIYAAAHLGRLIGEPNLIVLDIGGTTAKCTLVRDGHVQVSTEYHVERTRKHPGYPIQTPVSDIVEIGNGGGSIAWVDEGGKLHVGPQSAGAFPGPAAYGRGGTQPTTTDANLLLGRIDLNSLAGGEIKADLGTMKAAFEPLAQRLGTTVVDAARGVIRIANSNMTNALRLVSTNKGHDPRDFVLMAFGGGGPMHAVALAEELNIPRVIVPVNAAVFSAWGMLLTDLRRDFIRTRPIDLQSSSAGEISRQLDEMEEQARAEFSDGHARALLFSHHADCRYLGQEHTVKVPLGRSSNGAVNLIEAESRFHEAHEQRFTYRLDTAVQIVNLHLIATVPVPKPDLPTLPRTGRTLEAAVLHHREVDFDRHGVHRTTVYDGGRLEPGMSLMGPAIVQEPSTVLVISPGHRVEVDDFGNYHVHLDAGGN